MPATFGMEEGRANLEIDIWKTEYRQRGFQYQSLKTSSKVSIV